MFARTGAGKPAAIDPCALEVVRRRARVVLLDREREREAVVRERNRARRRSRPRTTVLSLSRHEMPVRGPKFLK